MNEIAHRRRIDELTHQRDTLLAAAKYARHIMADCLDDVVDMKQSQAVDAAIHRLADAIKQCEEP